MVYKRYTANRSKSYAIIFLDCFCAAVNPMTTLCNNVASDLVQSCYLLLLCGVVLMLAYFWNTPRCKNSFSTVCKKNSQKSDFWQRRPYKFFHPYLPHRVGSWKNIYKNRSAAE